jgi:hypothetical protein
MGGVGSGRPASGKKNKSRLTLEEKIERNRVRARERWQRLKLQKEKEPELKGQSLYKLHYKERYHADEERLGYLRQGSKRLGFDESLEDFMKEIRETNSRRLDEILNDPQAMERIFADREDITFIQKVTQRQKKYMSAKEIKEIERKLNEEFNLVEDRRGYNQSTYKNTEDDNNE